MNDDDDDATSLITATATVAHATTAGWNCTRCTLANRWQHRTCKACGLRRPPTPEHNNNSKTTQRAMQQVTEPNEKKNYGPAGNDTAGEGSKNNESWNDDNHPDQKRPRKRKRFGTASSGQQPKVAAQSAQQRKRSIPHTYDDDDAQNTNASRRTPTKASITRLLQQHAAQLDRHHALLLQAVQETTQMRAQVADRLGLLDQTTTPSTHGSETERQEPRDSAVVLDSTTSSPAPAAAVSATAPQLHDSKEADGSHHDTACATERPHRAEGKERRTASPPPNRDARPASIQHDAMHERRSQGKKRTATGPATSPQPCCDASPTSTKHERGLQGNPRGAAGPEAAPQLCRDESPASIQRDSILPDRDDNDDPLFLTAAEEEADPDSQPSQRLSSTPLLSQRPTTTDTPVSPLGDGTAVRRVTTTQPRNGSGNTNDVVPLQLVFTRVVAKQKPVVGQSLPDDTTMLEPSPQQSSAVDSARQKEQTKAADSTTLSQQSSQTMEPPVRKPRRRSKFSKESSKKLSSSGSCGWKSNAPSRAFLDSSFEPSNAKSAPKGSSKAVARPAPTAWRQTRRPQKKADDDDVDFAYKGDRVRCHSARQGLVCHDCYQCQRFFAVLAQTGHGNDEDDEENVLRPRHRAVCQPNDTPDNFWDLDFADEKDA